MARTPDRRRRSRSHSGDSPIVDDDLAVVRPIVDDAANGYLPLVRAADAGVESARKEDRSWSQPRRHVLRRCRG